MAQQRTWHHKLQTFRTTGKILELLDFAQCFELYSADALREVLVVEKFEDVVGVENKIPVEQQHIPGEVRQSYFTMPPSTVEWSSTLGG